MDTKIYKKLIHLNEIFFKKNKREGNIFVDVQMTDVNFVVSVMKISSAISDVLNCYMTVVSAIRARNKTLKLIKSYGPLRIISAKHLIVQGFLFNLFKILSLARKINTGNDLVNLKIQNIPIGIHIYDLILTRRKLCSIGKISFLQRFYLIVEISFFYSMLNYFTRNKISYAILADNAYRQGIIFEILKYKRIPSVSGIDINGISMHKYEFAEDYMYHCRTPDMDIVNKVMRTSKLSLDAENYLLRRILGQEEQHDIVRAYSKAKMGINRASLMNSYGLHPDKKIILVMAHIFCDAPHSYPNMLFKDYEDWLLKTCFRLAKNPNINFLVKEHPSVDLYNENGKIDSILRKYGLERRLLSKNINTKSLFNCVDVVITCGTAGMEFPCFGVPSLAAAKSPYSSFLFNISPDTEMAYYAEIDRIHKYNKLSADNIQLAKSVLYVIHSVMKEKKDKIGLGSQYCFKGQNFDTNLFLEEMIADARGGVGYFTLVSVMQKFLNGTHKNLINYSEIND